jgi:hypothetical protein
MKPDAQNHDPDVYDFLATGAFVTLVSKKHHMDIDF